jgi:hypothetical protein
MLQQMTLRGLEVEEFDSKAFITRCRWSTTSSLKSSIKVLAIKLDWLPPSSTHSEKAGLSRGDADENGGRWFCRKTDLLR